jgi:hypothetical protein
MATVIETFNNDPRNKIKAKLNEYWEKTKAAGWSLLDWASKNKEISVPLALGLGSLIFDKARVHNREVKNQREMETKLRTIYDRHTGITYYMNRIPKRKQLQQINARLKNDDDLGDILDDLGLL